MERINREEFYLQSAGLVARRSTCLRGQVGCVLVRGKRIVVSGYNGAPSGMPHCSEVGCLLTDEDGQLVDYMGCQRAVHAEANAIAFAAREGIPLKGTSLWCTHGPCPKCAQLIVNAGIYAVHYVMPYRLRGGVELLDDAGVVVKIHEEFDGLAG